MCQGLIKYELKPSVHSQASCSQHIRRHAHRLDTSAASSVVCTQKVISVQGLSLMGVAAMNLQHRAHAVLSVQDLPPKQKTDKSL
jgi:hypothetical protein